VQLVEAGLPNLLHQHTIKLSGVNPVVCINSFTTDSKEEIRIVKEAAEAAGAHCAVSTHLGTRRRRRAELADIIIDACRQKNDFRFLYPNNMKLRQRVEKIAINVYGAGRRRFGRRKQRPKLKSLKTTRLTTNTVQ